MVTSGPVPRCKGRSVLKSGEASCKLDCLEHRARSFETAGKSASMNQPSQPSPTRVVVLGASGFIGRWVAAAFSDAGAVLWCPVRSPETAQPIFDQLGIRASVLQIDLLDRPSLWQLLGEVRPHLVVNLAGYGVDPRERDAALTRAMNLELVEALIDWIARHSAADRAALLHAGSALEYGAVGGDLREETVPNPTTVYGQSKLAATRAIAAAVERGELQAIVARLFTVYGAGEHPGRLLPSLLAGVGNTQRIPLTDGHQKRDFTYVGDVAEGFVRLAAMCEAGTHPVMNLSTGVLTSVRGFIEQAAPILGIATDRLGFGDLGLRAEEMEHSEVSNRRLTETLGWQPATSIPEGILRTLKAGTRHTAPA